MRAKYIAPWIVLLPAPDVAATLNTSTDTGRALLDAMVTQQATVIAYQNDFKLLMILTLAMTPLLATIGSSRAPRAGAGKPAEVHAMD